MSLNYDVVYCILNFSMPTKSGHKYMNKQSFYDNVYNSVQFHKALESDQIMGLLTHKGRYYEQLDPKIPYADNIILDRWWANILKKIEIKGDEVLAYLKLVDRDGGNAVRTILKEGTPLGVSMSTFCDNSILHEYVITSLLGVDHTMDPAFLGTRLVSKNFSEGMFNSLQSNVSTSIYTKDQRFNIVNFSYDNAVVLENRLDVGNIYNIPLDLSQNVDQYFSAVNEFDKYFMDKNSLKSFDINSTIIMQEAAKGQLNFSLLKQMMVEAGYPPHRRLARRIEELIREVKGKTSDHIERYKEVYYSFINTPIYDWISKAFNSDKKIMLAIGLRLGKYMKDPSIVQSADRKLEMIKKRRASYGGVFDKQAQKQLDGVLRELFNELWKYIEEKANVTFESNGTVNTMLKTFDNLTSFKTVEDWLDAGSDGQKDYNKWVDAFPYNSKDLNEYIKSKKYYGETEVDKLIDLVANKNISAKDKQKLVTIMKDSNIKNFSNNSLESNNKIVHFDDGVAAVNDNQPLTPEELQKNSLENRTLTTADIDMIITKLLENPEGLEILANKMIEMGYANPPSEGGTDPSMNDNPPQNEGQPPAEGQPVDNNMGQVPIEGQSQPQADTGGNPPVENNPPVDDSQPIIAEDANNQQAQAPQSQVPQPVVNDSQYAKPKSISKEQAQSLMSFSRVEELNYVKALENFSDNDKRKIISFSVIELINPMELFSNDIDVIHFALGAPNGVSREIINDLMSAKYQFFSGVISEDDYNSIKTNLMCNLVD